jgi:PKD repeat protein
MDLVRYNGSGQFQFMVKSGGSWTVVSTTGYPISNGAYYWLRFEVQGSSVSYRVWPANGIEPSTWTWSGTSSVITTAGTTGLYGWAASGSEDEFDSFSVASLGGVTDPTARVTLSPSSAPAGGSITANASASSAGTYPISTYTFNFGDGTTVGPQPGATASHVYAKGGVFTVTLTVTDTAGNSSQTTVQATIGQPVAALTVTPPSGSPPLAVTANASGSTDTTGVAITAYTFNFGDGTTVGPQTSQTAGHTYTLAGTYTVSLTVTDTTGATATQTQTVTAATAATPPTAALNVSPSWGKAPLIVSADASGSAAGSHPISSYTFNYGDGRVDGPQAGDKDSHTYLAPGMFTVTVTVADSAGLTSSATQTVTVTSTYLVQDTFQRANQSGWGTASDGMTWSSGTGLSISGNEGAISYSGASQFENLGTATTTDGNGLMRFSIGAPSDTAGILLRQQTNGNWALGRYDGQGHVQLIVRVGGSQTSVSKTAVTVGINTYYWLRFELQGTNVYLKLWADGTSEPSAWTWSGTSSLLTGAGTTGLYGWAAAGSTAKFDSFSVAAISSAPPNSTISGTALDSTTGSGIAGVTVSTTPASTSATTSSSGTYSLPVASGTYTVVFTASGLGYNDNDLANVTAPAGGGAVASQRLLAVPGQVAMDTFTQPDQTGGWSPSTDGHVWTSDLGSPPNGVPAKAGITANQAWVDTSGSTLEDVDSWMGYGYANQEVSADVDTTALLADPKYQHGPRLLARVQVSGSSWNAIVMTIDPPDGSNSTCTAGDLALWVTVPSTWTELATVCQTVSTGTLYHAKLDVVGNLIEGKVWASGTAEPGWQISATQTSPNQILGPGLSGTRTTGSYVDWSAFAEAPITQITGQVTAASNSVPIKGATVTLSNGLTTTTDSSGNYSFSGLRATLPGGTAYTVTVSATGYTTGSSTTTPTVGATSTVNLSLT